MGKKTSVLSTVHIGALNLTLYFRFIIWCIGWQSNILHSNLGLITLFRFIAMLCETDNIPRHIPGYFSHSVWMWEIHGNVLWNTISPTKRCYATYNMCPPNPTKTIQQGISSNTWIYNLHRSPIACTPLHDYGLHSEIETCASQFNHNYNEV
jgi:hypothetical protein